MTAGQARQVRSKRRGRAPRVNVMPDNRVVIGQTSVDAERVIATLREHGLIV